MMTRCTSRLDMRPDPASVIQVLLACRQAMIGVQAKVRVSALMVMAAIGAMATLLKRDPEYFWARGPR